MTAYYNDHDPGACAWLRELIRAGLIPKGEVDDRSILDVEPADLAGFASCHFFAGIGGWAYALRLAGWRDEWPVWTGSPPCQPFSAAGKGLSRDDPRHLAPHFVQLVRACRPGLLFGEQVASAEVFGRAAGGAGKRAAAQPEWAWLDDLSDRLEAARYAVGASDIPAAGIGAPHIRQRTFFGAVDLDGLEHAARNGRLEWRAEPSERGAGPGCGVSGLADANDAGSQGRAGMPERAGERAAWSDGMACGLADAEHPERWALSQPRENGCDGAHGGREEAHCIVGARSEVYGLADAAPEQHNWTGHGRPGWRDEHSDCGDIGRPDPLDGFWRGADWLWCRDAKWRPVEPGLEPLAHGLPARVGRLRGYGNAIVPQVAAQFVTAFCEAAGLPLSPQEQHQ